MTAHISRDWTVQQALQGRQDAVSVFIHLKTNCVGCWLERFCTLEEVSSIYGISIEALLESLCNPVPSPKPKE